MPHSVASDLALHCLLMFLLWKAKLLLCLLRHNLCPLFISDNKTCITLIFVNFISDYHFLEGKGYTSKGGNTFKIVWLPSEKVSTPKGKNLNFLE